MKVPQHGAAVMGIYQREGLGGYQSELPFIPGAEGNDGQTSVEEVGIAAPVDDHRGDAMAAVLLSAPRFRIPAGMLELLGNAVADTAKEISGRLGYRPSA